MDYPLENRSLKISPDSHQRSSPAQEMPNLSQKPGPQMSMPPASATPGHSPSPSSPSIQTTVKTASVANPDGISGVSYMPPSASSEEIARLQGIQTQISSLRGVSRSSREVSASTSPSEEKNFGLSQRGLPRAEI